jgi:hypothetical protein
VFGSEPGNTLDEHGLIEDCDFSESKIELSSCWTDPGRTLFPKWPGFVVRGAPKNCRLIADRYAWPEAWKRLWLLYGDEEVFISSFTFELARCGGDATELERWIRACPEVETRDE